MNDAASKDPRWHQVIEIAAKSWIDGVCVAVLDPSPAQRFVETSRGPHAKPGASFAVGRRSTTLRPPVRMTLRSRSPSPTAIQTAGTSNAQK
jgi:hypothetical protein